MKQFLYSGMNFAVRFLRSVTVLDLFCVGGFAMLGAGLWEVSKSLALCTLGGLMLIIWLVQFLRAGDNGGRR